MEQIKNGARISKANKKAAEEFMKDLISGSAFVFQDGKLEVKKGSTEESVFNKHIMCTSSIDNEFFTYTLVRCTKNSSEIIMCKTLREEKKFKEEVNNLAKYFNADLLEEK